MALDVPTGVAEQKLLLQVLEQGIPLEEVKNWLDDAFQGASVEAKTPKSYRHSTFEQYDAITFVVIVLNFLREDASPLLTPTSVQEGAPEGLPGAHKKGGDTPSAKRGQLPANAFDIASADDFPSLALGEAPRGPRGGSKQKRRIRPTPLTDSEKPSEGDITVFGAGAPSSFSTTDDAASGRLQVRARRTERFQQPQPLEMAARQRTLAFTGDQAKTNPLSVPFRESGSRTGDGMKLAPKAVVDHAEVDEGRGEDESGISHLREVTSGTTPKLARLARQCRVMQSGDGEDAKEGVRNHGETASSLLFTIDSSALDAGGSNGIDARSPAADCAQCQRDPIGGSVTMRVVNCEHPSFGQAAAHCSPFTPTKQSTTGSTTPFGGEPPSWDDCFPPATPVMTPTAPTTRTAAEQTWRQGQEPPLAIMASLYVHIMIRRFVPSLATEMHLTVRLLHVHPDVARGSSSTTIHSSSPALGQNLLQHSSSRSIPPSPAVDVGQGEGDGCTRVRPPQANIIFKNGLDCRSFAACVLLGLKSLLPHLGTDTLDLLAGSLAVASESEDLIDEVRHVLCEARDDGVKAIDSGGRSLGQKNADDTAIVQSVGAPFAALQWREEDSVNNFRTTSDRTLFQNRQESVDRFGSLLRDYQGSKKGLQQYPERALQDLRTAASTLIGALAPENFGWLAQYFLGQLVGWGLAPPEETDSEVMALVAPAGDKGRATLQKLHRRISTPSVGEDGNAAKSSQKLRYPGTQPRQTHTSQDRVSSGVGDSRLPKAVGQQRPRKVGAGPRQSKSQTPSISARVPTAPLQLRWFPGNQDFFYHVLLALDSYTFNSHLKTELVAEIARLYYQQTASKTRGVSVVRHNDGTSGASDDSKSTAGERVRGFTDTMVKLKVLAKFLGLLTFSPNWGIPVSDVASNLHEGPSSYTDKKAYATCCPLPLDTYLDHAWSTKGLVGVVPWVADFLRMMKWDDISSQADFYKRTLGTLASIHAQSCMRPDHPTFTECLLAVSCEIETLFQDLGSDLGVHGYRLLSVASTPTSFGFLGQGNALGSTQQQSGGDQKSTFSTRAFSKPECGSLDAEVVLSRRLIQNCCPYLEDVLTLIGSLGRAWKLRSSTGDGTLLRSTRSPRAVGATGASPRSRRVIKPHPLRPLLVLPSLLEHHQRVKGFSDDTGTEPGNAQTENARLRLVEAFFHSLPGELQVSADFVVRRAVQNACEEVLAAVIKPAVATVIGRLVVSLKEDDKTVLAPNLGSLTGGPFRGSLGVPNISRQRMDQRIAWAISSVEGSVGSKARSLAGRIAHAIAKATTLSLVPHSLPLRVRQTAAAIAGHHAQEAAKRKIEELATATVSDAVVACHAGMEKTREDVSQAGLSRQQNFRGHSADSMGREGGQGGLPCPPVLVQALPITSQSSELPALVSALCGACSAYCREATSRQEGLLNAAQRAAESNTDDMQAVASVLSGTLHLVKVVRYRLESRSGQPDGNDAHIGEAPDCGLHCQIGKGEDLQMTRSLPIQDHGVGQTSNTLRAFLSLLAEIWGCLHRTCPNQHIVVRALRHTFTSTSTPGETLEDLVHLAAIAVKEISTSDSGPETLCAERYTSILSTDGSLVRGRSGASTREGHPRCPPWAPALELMSWGVLPAVNAENVLLSCVQAVAKGRQRGKQAQTECAVGTSSKAVIAVITAIAKGYHSLAVGEDLSAVLLADLLDAAARSLTRNVVVKASSYHSMHLCRLVARLIAM